MTTLLEARYRTVLRLLPSYYREAREEEMVEVYLWDVDQETQDQSRPTLGEVASIAALAVRSRLAATGAPRRYALFGSAVRNFALYAVLLQAAVIVSDEVLRVTWSATRGPREWDLFLTGFTGSGPLPTVVAIAGWVLPLLWTVTFFALVHDRRRLARAAVLLAALPSLWPLIEPLVTEWPMSAPYFVTANALFAWLPALAVCAAYHRDAPPAALPPALPGWPSWPAVSSPAAPSRCCPPRSISPGPPPPASSSPPSAGCCCVPAARNRGPAARRRPWRCSAC